jgi:two-component system response regulator RegX3
MERKIRILVVEDELPIRVGLADVFLYHGFRVDTAAEGRDALAKALGGNYDLILLDVMLPGIDGFEICERVRAQYPEQPIIMLTAKTADEDIVHGLSLGADDYVAKPFSVTQLVLRVKAVLRRSRIGVEELTHIRLGEEVEVDVRNLCGKRSGEHLVFTRREVEILQYLGANSDRPASRDELLAKVWGYGQTLGIETRTVDIHVAKLRRKIEPDPAQPRYLVTVRGAGYRLLTR